MNGLGKAINMMRKFCLFSLAYLAIAMVVLVIFRENPYLQLIDGARRSYELMTAFVKYMPFLLGAVAVLLLIARQFVGLSALREALWALLACLLFSTAFTFLKTSIPYIVPFWADPLFADLDKWLHFGQDPWVWTHAFASWIPADWVSFLYLIVWGLPAVFFPFLLALIDTDAERIKRFLVLHAFVWIGLGNILATVFSSVGPIYFDRLLGTERFSDFAGAIVASGIAETRLGQVQVGLWKVYAEFSQTVGSGISAFPSVHNGVATLVMLYLFERARPLAPIGVIFCVSILFCSVYNGWHYALDGYVSIILVSMVWWIHRRFTANGRRNVAFASANPA